MPTSPPRTYSPPPILQTTIPTLPPIPSPVHPQKKKKNSPWTPVSCERWRIRPVIEWRKKEDCPVLYSGQCYLVHPLPYKQQRCFYSSTGRCLQLLRFLRPLIARKYLLYTSTFFRNGHKPIACIKKLLPRSRILLLLAPQKKKRLFFLLFASKSSFPISKKSFWVLEQ